MNVRRGNFVGYTKLSSKVASPKFMYSLNATKRFIRLSNGWEWTGNGL